MKKEKTVRIKRCHSFVDIPEHKYNPDKHELYEDDVVAAPVKEDEPLAEVETFSFSSSFDEEKPKEKSRRKKTWA